MMSSTRRQPASRAQIAQYNEDPFQFVSLCEACCLRPKAGKKSRLCRRCNATASRTAKSSKPSKNEMMICRQVDQRAMDRVQLLQTFLASYIPSNGETEVGLASHSPLLELPNIHLSSPMISSAVDTLCLAHLGNKKQDQRLLHASQDAYGRVLTSMRQAIGSKNNGIVASRDVIASCLLMSMYDDGMPGETQFQNYATHLFGAMQYAQAQGPSCLDTDQAFDERLLLCLRFQSLFVSAARRRNFFWTQPGWQTLEARIITGNNSQFFPYMVPLPGLLETADKFLIRNPSECPTPERFSIACRALDQFRAQMMECIETDSSGRPGIAALMNLEDFDIEIEERCFMSTSTTFTTFHTFSDAAHATRYMLSCFFSLVADCTLLRLLREYPEVESILGRTFRDVEQKAFISATEICRSVYYYSNLNSLAYAHVLCVWLDLAQTVFEEHGSMKEVGWCQACLIATKLRINRLAPIRLGTLCRVGDMFGAFTKACRYRTSPRPHISELRSV